MRATIENVYIQNRTNLYPMARRTTSTSHDKRWSWVKTGLTALFAAQATAIAAVHTVDRMRRRRIPGGQKGFPTLPPQDTYIQDNEVRVYTDGTSLYGDMIAAIDSAKHTVLFESYIWRKDTTGRLFKDALIAAARRGVNVFIIYDGFGSFNQGFKFFQLPDLPTLHVRRFPTIRSGLFTLNIRKTGRDHRKILVVDSEVAFVGGYNIGDPFGLEWRDTHVRVTGPAVWELENGFTDFWNHFKMKRHPALPDRGARKWSAQVTAAFNLPSRMLFPVRGLYIDAMDRATKSIHITSAYFIPDREILQALVSARRRGVDVNVLIPEYSNHILADWIAWQYYGELLREGVKIWLYQHAMVHSKTMTVDGRWSTIGTANIDRLSMQGNFEVNMQFHSTDLARTMEEIFANDLTTARPLTIEEWEHRPLIARFTEKLLSPFEYIV